MVISSNVTNRFNGWTNALQIIMIVLEYLSIVSMNVHVAGVRSTIAVRTAQSVENAPLTTADGTTDGRSDIDQIPPANGIAITTQPGTGRRGVRSGAVITSAAATKTTTAVDLQAKSEARRALPTTASAVIDRVTSHVIALQIHAQTAHLCTRNARRNPQRAVRALRTRGKEDPREPPR